jgi:hypothetical protein
MRETNKPEPGFVYTCEAGHEWFVPLTDWEARGANTCQACFAQFEEDHLGVTRDTEPGQPS